MLVTKGQVNEPSLVHIMRDEIRCGRNANFFSSNPRAPNSDIPKLINLPVSVRIRVTLAPHASSTGVPRSATFRHCFPARGTISWASSMSTSLRARAARVPLLPMCRPHHQVTTPPCVYPQARPVNTTGQRIRLMAPATRSAELWAHDAMLLLISSAIHHSSLHGLTALWIQLPT
mmetsp:Transcript_2838/g.6777  ORF Transcript_2838/g.6777 Transcript_2838/m.6777 type:complete len:175 (+) Transcript_2838:650-1174(+)